MTTSTGQKVTVLSHGQRRLVEISQLSCNNMPMLCVVMSDLAYNVVS